MEIAVAVAKPSLRRRLGLGNRGGLAGYVFVAPSIIFLIAFVILPIIAALFYSFTDYDLMKAPRLAGLKNYKNLFDDARILPRVDAAAPVPGV
ncbi:uncharacterized protein METZ01_LOCUS486740, partial [marine metagenome]